MINIFSNLSKEEKINKLKAVKKLDINHDTFLIYGTLLGAVRENALIGHDDDIDIAYLSKKTNIKEIIEETKQIYNDLASKNQLVKWFDIDYKGRNDIWNIDTVSGQAHVKIDGVIFDLFTMWKDNEDNLWFFEFGKLLKASDHFPLEKGSIYDIEFNIPRNADKMLTKLYGDWKTPKKEKPCLNRKIWLKELLK